MSPNAAVISRDGGRCVLCGVDLVDVAHIVASNSGDQAHFIRQLVPFSDFDEDDPSNLLCFCPTHHRQFELGYFVLVPSKRQRELMHEHELRDFATRRGKVTRAGLEGDPGRTFPELHLDSELTFTIQRHMTRPYSSSTTSIGPVLCSISARPISL